MATKRLAPMIVIVGQTASGKSDLAIDLAKKIGGEIICADSRTIYKGMDIGTAKPSLKDQKRVPHHLLDIVEPGQKYSAAQFQKDVFRLIDEVTQRGNIPLLVGGSGLYIDAVIFNYQFGDSEAERDPKNPRHLKRASKETLTNSQQLRQNTLVIGLNLDRELLKLRIAKRVEHMIDDGLVREVRKLGERYGWDSEAMSGIGYRFFGQYVRGEIDLNEAKAKFIQGDLSLAKRQRTWFKRNKYIHWISDKNRAFTLVQTFLNSSEP